MHTLNESEPEELYVDTVTKDETNKEDWLMTLKVNDIQLELKLDTGAQANIMSETAYKKIKPRPKLHTTKVKVSGYSDA